MEIMRLSIIEAVFAIASVIGWFMTQIFAKDAKLKRVLKWLFGAACFLALVAFVWPYGNDKEKSNVQSQTATASGNNSPAVNQSASPSGSNNTVNQSAPTAVANNSSNSPVTQVTESTNVTVKNNSENPAINAPANSGNIAIQMGGTNNSITQSIVNRGPEPEIEIISRSLNVETNLIGVGRAYVTTLLVRIHNPPTYRFRIKYTFDHPMPLLAPPSSTPAGGIWEGNFVRMESSAVTFLTTEKVQESDFHFSIDPY
ncbi:MAG: hypothetical protein ACREDQ_00440 [Limisphaerales bacterium]